LMPVSELEVDVEEIVSVFCSVDQDILPDDCWQEDNNKMLNNRTAPNLIKYRLFLIYVISSLNYFSLSIAVVI
jgi:hypothetical protein